MAVTQEPENLSEEETMRKLGVFVVLMVVSFAFVGCKASGEKLWTKACDHSIELMKKTR